VGHLWCHRIAEEIKQVAELVAVLVDETMTVAAGGTIYDDKGKPGKPKAPAATTPPKTKKDP